MTANFFVSAMTIQCAVAATLYYFDQQYPLALMYGGYTVANIGILWIALKSAA